MKNILLITLIMSVFACSDPKKSSIIHKVDSDMPMKYLALGDSYTIGEGVEEEKRYPNQLVSRINDELELTFSSPTIIAKTGWTVEELLEAIEKSKTLESHYNLVTVLIGVNNQYQGKSVEEFKVEFKKLLLQAIGFAGNLPDHVIVLSIPDWGVTPFAETKGVDQEKVASEIDAFNNAKKEICEIYGVPFLEITDHYRKIGSQPEMLVEDQLHPSGLVYAHWADLLLNQVETSNLEPR